MSYKAGSSLQAYTGGHHIDAEDAVVRAHVPVLIVASEGICASDCTASQGWRLRHPSVPEDSGMLLLWYRVASVERLQMLKAIQREAVA